MKHYEDYQQRVIDERAALGEKLIKLQNFLASNKIKDLPEEDVKLLTQQAGVMLEYHRILTMRIIRFDAS